MSVRCIDASVIVKLALKGESYRTAARALIRLSGGVVLDGGGVLIGVRDRLQPPILVVVRSCLPFSSNTSTTLASDEAISHSVPVPVGRSIGIPMVRASRMLPSP